MASSVRRRHHITRHIGGLHPPCSPIFEHPTECSSSDSPCTPRQQQVYDSDSDDSQWNVCLDTSSPCVNSGGNWLLRDKALALNNASLNSSHISTAYLAHEGMFTSLRSGIFAYFQASKQPSPRPLTSGQLRLIKSNTLGRTCDLRIDPKENNARSPRTFGHSMRQRRSAQQIFSQDDSDYCCCCRPRSIQEKNTTVIQIGEGCDDEIHTTIARSRHSISCSDKIRCPDDIQHSPDSNDSGLSSHPSSPINDILNSKSPVLSTSVTSFGSEVNSDRLSTTSSGCSSKDRSDVSSQSSTDKRKRVKPLSKWNMGDILTWLQELELNDAASIVAGYDLTGKDIVRWNSIALANLGFAAQDRQVVLAEVEKLKSIQLPPPNPASTTTLPPPTPTRPPPTPTRAPPTPTPSVRSLLPLLSNDSAEHQILVVSLPSDVVSQRQIAVAEHHTGALVVTRVDSTCALDVRKDDRIIEIDGRTCIQMPAVSFNAIRLNNDVAASHQIVILRDRESESICTDSSEDVQFVRL